MIVPCAQDRSDMRVAILSGQQRMLHCHLQNKMNSGCLVPQESRCRKRGVSHNGQWATFPLFLPSLKLHNCWHCAGRVPFALSPLLAMQTSLCLVICYCSCRASSCHIPGSFIALKMPLHSTGSPGTDHTTTRFGREKAKHTDGLWP